MSPEIVLNGYGTSMTYAPSFDFPSDDSEGNAKPRKFQFIPVCDLIQNLQPPKWLIHGYLEQHTMCSVFGDPGSGKSFVAIDKGCCIATGTAWHGNAVSQGTVFYIAGEGHNGLARRFSAWEKHHGVAIANLYVATRAAQFCDLASAEAVANAVQELVDATGKKPSLIIIDTLARNFGDGDENSTKDMNKFIQHIDELKDRWDAAALIVHHTGHGDKTRGRGAMSLKGALDHEFRIQKDESGMVSLENTKTKDGPSPDPLYFQILTVPVTCKDGNMVDGGTLAEINGQPKSKDKKLSGQKRRAFEILQNCIIDKGIKRYVQGGMTLVTCVTLDEFRSELRNSNFCASDEPDSVSKAIARAIEGLNNAKISVSYNDYIWLSDKPDKSRQTRIDQTPQSDGQDNTL
jgi:hypothetical protein